MSSFYENNETIRHRNSSADIPREFPAQSSKKCLDCKIPPPRGPPDWENSNFSENPKWAAPLRWERWKEGVSVT